VDLISHGLMGSMLAGLGLQNKFGAAGVAATVIANIAPDLDVVSGLKGPKCFYKYHREITHSLLGATVLGLLISAGIYFFTPLHNWWAVLAMVFAGLFCHLLMDSLTPWGLPLFYPFSSKKYGFDLIWFIDPVIIASMIGGVSIGYQLPEYSFVAYLAALWVIGSYLVLRVAQKRRARRLAEEELTPRYRDAEVFILPSAISPFYWDVIFKVRGYYLYVSVDSRRREVLRTREFTSAAYHRCVRLSQESSLVDVFLRRSRFPFYSVTKEDGCYTVEWLDAHLLNLGGVHGVTVCLNENGEILKEKLCVKKPVRRRARRKVEDYLQEEAS